VVAKLNGDNAQWAYDVATQPIAAINRVRQTLNKQIRVQRGFEGRDPLNGERVICCRNDRDMAIFNGALGDLITDGKRLLDGENFRLSVAMEDLRVPLKNIPVNRSLFDQHFDETIQKPERLSKGIQLFDYGYALTAHKAQGSEFPDVTVIDDSGVFRADQWKWRYTAATRASEGLKFLVRG
jgi:exodeoxyribonuclease-5